MKSRYVFGPVSSPRLGRWLGIDPLGTGLVQQRLCNLNCVYCEVGKGKPVLETFACLSTAPILAEVERRLASAGRAIDTLAVVAAGEPTLCSEIGELVKGLKSLSPVPVAVMTNAVSLVSSEMRESLAEADILMPSLDAASPKIYKTICRPYPGQPEVDEIIEALAALRTEFDGTLCLMTVLVKGLNDSLTELKLLKEAMGRIQPDVLSLSTLTRPAVSGRFQAVGQEELDAAAALLGPPVVTSLFNVHYIREKAAGETAEGGNPQAGPAAGTTDQVRRFLALRPGTFLDISDTLNLKAGELQKALDELMAAEEIAQRALHRGSYYVALPKGTKFPD